MILIVIKSCMAHVEIIYDTCAWNDERYKGYIIYVLIFHTFYQPNIKVEHKPVPRNLELWTLIILISIKTLVAEKYIISIFTDVFLPTPDK